MSRIQETPPEIWEARRGPLALAVADAESENHARIIHSYAFRRLQGKTQVLGARGGDFYRTRLTHSLEVAELGRAMLDALHARPTAWTARLPSRTLLANLCLAHDLGHPPFGHAGERTLDAAMRGLNLPDSGSAGSGGSPVGFEANGQTLRLLTYLEAGPDPGGHGLNLTRRLLLGVLKYPVAYSWAAQQARVWPPKCYLDTEQSVVDWLLAPLGAADRERLTRPAPDPAQPAEYHRSFDCRLMELADDAAYSIYDLEDGVNLELINREDWEALAAQRPELVEVPQLSSWATQIFSGDEAECKCGVAALSRTLVTGVDVSAQSRFEEPLLDLRADFTPQAAALQAFLKALVYRQVIDTPQVREPEARACLLLRRLFDAAQADPQHWLGAGSRRRLAGSRSEAERARVVCDYLAGMTDSYALDLAARVQ
ncbi:anti-phage deoxyguanosine triphosphatase [Deinococcus rubellus]|uniref:DNTP triphosphohydrolase n=1 Tax=Deinococcus rubellus TaxID=1889240 RepID=A0ABY5YMB1_9DEIO|nr:dNTP triphosphohydrolase [Deinococcus rubellus]UWX65394.1 dNTP triphosphohydrolase [Deinococcus rubellus]